MSNPTKAENLARLLINLTALGFTFAEAQRLRRIEMTLSRWSTEECNGTIQRDGEDGDGKPYRTYGGYVGGLNQEPGRHFIPDREAGARKQLDAIMAAHPELWSYHQGDPRGVALYVGRKADLPKDYFTVTGKGNIWRVKPHYAAKPYGFTFKTAAEARDFAARETLSSNYNTRGVAVHA